MAGFGIGQPMRRVEDKRFLTGTGTYVEDISLAHQAYGVPVLSPHPHAIIKGIDKSAAEAAPGVLLVLTGADMAGDNIGPFFGLMPEDLGLPKGFRAPRWVLTPDRARHVGDRVAFVVAETLEQAYEAAELVEVDYEVIPSTVSLEEAVKPGAPQLYPEAANNVCFELAMGDAAAVDAAFAKATHKVSLRMLNNRLSANSK
jgi:carbon-monoxide dehydrogenase large subunit